MTDYRAYKLGLSVQEYDRLLAFRKTGKYINSPLEFKIITKISDSLFKILKPLFKFPDWLGQNKKTNSSFTNKTTLKINSKNLNLATIKDLKKIKGIGQALANRIVKFRTSLGGFSNQNQLKKVYGLKPEIANQILKYYFLKPSENKIIQKSITKTIQDINKTTAVELQKVYGIGKKYSERIIKYRNSIGGYLNKEQLYDVYGLKKETVNELFKHFDILSKPNIKKININEATFKEILHLPYIDFKLTKKIFEYKDEFAEIQDLEELKKIDGFPLEKYDKIVLYLTTEY